MAEVAEGQISHVTLEEQCRSHVIQTSQREGWESTGVGAKVFHGDADVLL